MTTIELFEAWDETRKKTRKAIASFSFYVVTNPFATVKEIDEKGPIEKSNGGLADQSISMFGSPMCNTNRSQYH